MGVPQTAMSGLQDRAEAVRGPAEPALLDVRFRNLLGEEAWLRLPHQVRRRFSKRLAAGETRLYQGRVERTELTWAGRVLAELTRLIGGPLPRTHGETGPAVVIVAENEGLGGQSWTRSYAREGRFPQVVHSAKRFRGPTGLEEHVGCGIGMTLRVSEEDRSFVFRSERYFFDLLGLRIYLPRFLEPGCMEIRHTQLTDENLFSFELRLTHPLCGRMLTQLARFEEV